MNILIALIIISIVLRILDYFYYRDDKRILILLGLDSSQKKSDFSYYKRFDPFFTLFPFIWSWCDIAASAWIVNNYFNLFTIILCVLFVGTRMRALQEASHTAVHYGLCRYKAWQWEISNIFFQFPHFKPDMAGRFKLHVVQHHRNPNVPNKDPNLTRFKKVGVVPGISAIQFYYKLFHPLTLKGFYETISTMWQNIFINKSTIYLIFRLLVTSIFLGLFYYFFNLRGLIFAYILPLVTTYPFYSWISVLAEHRWYVICTENKDKKIIECINCRPTDYRGVLGWIIKHSIFPGTDHYHLAHSLYPFLRWNYMSAVDKALKNNDPYYAKYLSEGLIFPYNNRSKFSALSELKERLVNPKIHELNDWDKIIMEKSHVE